MLGSFLKKLKRKKITDPTSEDKKELEKENLAEPASKKTGDDSQLNVDIFRNPNTIVIYAQIAGASSQNLSIMIEGDGDVVTIRGHRIRPDGQIFENTDKEKETEKVLEECQWGKFYRQIILPAEVDSEKTEAKLSNGVLMLSLPLKGAEEAEGIRVPVTEV